MANYFGEKILVEQCQKISIKELLKSCKAKLKEIILKTEIETTGIKLELCTSKTLYNGIRYWLKCPLCSRRSGVLYKHPISGKIGCRKCLNLEYVSHRKE